MSDEERMGRDGRRDVVHDAVVAGGVTGLRVLADRLAEAGITDVSPDQLRSDLRALGAVRVQGADGPVLAIPVDGDGPPGRADVQPGLVAELTADPDWRLQVGVVAVVALFLLVVLVGWLISL